MTTRDNKYEMSWKAAFNAYSMKDLLWDSKWPILIAVVLLVISVNSCEFNHVEMIDKMCSILLNVLPPLLSILIASFSIWISFFLSKVFEKLGDNEKGKEILYELNASFLVNILFLLMGLIFVILTNICLSLGISISFIDGDFVNSIILFILYFMSVEFVWLLKDIAKNLHNVAKFSILF